MPFQINFIISIDIREIPQSTSGKQYENEAGRFAPINFFFYYFHTDKKNHIYLACLYSSKESISLSVSIMAFHASRRIDRLSFLSVSPSIVSLRRRAELSVMRKFTGLYYSPWNRHGSFTTVQLENPCSTLREILHRFRDEK